VDSILIRFAIYIIYYIYICVRVYLCMHIYACLFKLTVRTPVGAWPIQDMLSLVCVSAAIIYPFITPAHLRYPHSCNRIARLLHPYISPPDPPCICLTPYNIGKDNIVYRLSRGIEAATEVSVGVVNYIPITFSKDAICRYTYTYM